MVHLSASFSAILRVRVEDRPGAFADLARAIGDAGGSLDAIDLVRVEDGVKVRDVTIMASDAEHIERIVAAARTVRGVTVDHVSDRVFLAHLGGTIEMGGRIPLKTRDDLSIAVTKTGLGWGQAVALGILCNALVCLAVWLTYGAHSLMDRVIAVVPPITAFVALGFEHSIANMYFIPYALLVKGDTGWLAGRSGLPDLGRLGWGRFLWANLLPVTIGNIVGGAVLVGAVYWFAYLRPRADA